jgi:hypothetical protein
LKVYLLLVFLVVFRSISEAHTTASQTSDAVIRGPSQDDQLTSPFPGPGRTVQPHFVPFLEFAVLASQGTLTFEPAK